MDDNPLGNQPIPDAAKFAVGAQPQGQPQQAQAPQSAPQGTPQGGQPPAANMAQNLQDADTQHHSILGKAFRSIMGNDVSYQINPQTGKMEQQEVPQKPGQLWRGILAATILGGATAAKNKAPGFAQGAAEGGGAVVQHGEEQDQQKRAQAQQQFKDQLTARSANTEEQMKQAQISMHNAQTLHENKIMQQQDYVFHKEIAESGQKRIQPIIDADPTAVKFQDIPESEMNDLFKNNSRASGLLWEPTGTKIVFNKDGSPDVHATYTGVDPKDKVKITDTQIKHWEDTGMKQIYGNEWSALTDGKELTVQQYMAINQKSKELMNQKNTDKKAKFDEEKETAQINMTKAQTSHLKAEASKLYADENDKKAANEAFDILSSGKDIAKISIKGRKLLTDTIDGTIKTSVDELKALPKGLDGQVVDQDQAKDIYGTIEKYQKIRDRLYGIKEPVQAPSPQSNMSGGLSERATNISKIMTEDNGISGGTVDAYKYIQSSGLSPAEKRSLNIQMKNPIPDEEVTAMAKKAVISKKDMEKQLKDAGYVLKQDEDNKSAEDLGVPQG